MGLRRSRDPLGIAGTIIAEKYSVNQAMGEGGFSVVYKAEHTIWKQPVALKCFKILANAPAEQRDQLLDGFIQEGKLMAELSSRSAAIVQARDVGTFTTPDGQWIPYMVLEWLDGKPLDIVLYEESRMGLPLRGLHEVMALMEPAIVALEIVHGKGIAHRDIKPANFFIIGNPREMGAFVKVLDFGIAKVMAEHAAAATALAQTGKDITAFTPNYGAPEQFSRTHGATGPWTDVFAMALILVEMMLGRAALEGNDYIQLAVASRDPMRRPTPGAFGIQVSTAVEAVFAKALAVSPADRYSTMGRFWAALHQAVFPDSTAWNPGTSSGHRLMSPSSPSLGLVAPPSSGVPYQPSSGVSYQPSSGGLVMSQQGHMGPPSGPVQGLGSLASLPTPHSMPMATPMAETSAASVANVNTAPTRSSKALLAFGVIGVLAVLGGGALALKMLTGSSGSSATIPPLVTSSSAVQTASAAPVARRTTCPEDMVLVPGGKFFMGSDEDNFKLWQPAHKVTIDTFCIDINEVTAGEYKACSDKGECKRPAAVPDYPKSDSVSEADHEKTKSVLADLCTFGKDGLERHPINCISWDFADSYCKVHQKRLPTEAEWEFAARGSDGRKFPWGDEPGDHTFMNACGTECTAWETKRGLKPSPRMYEKDDGYFGTAPVGSFPKGKTKYGAYDFVGNVWEWTADWFETYKPDELVNPQGAPAGDKKAIRGGGYNGGFALWVNPAFRYHQIATASAPGIGFRCAMTL